MDLIFVMHVPKIQQICIMKNKFMQKAAINRQSTDWCRVTATFSACIRGSMYIEKPSIYM